MREILQVIMALEGFRKRNQLGAATGIDSVLEDTKEAATLWLERHRQVEE